MHFYSCIVQYVTNLNFNRTGSPTPGPFAEKHWCLRSNPTQNTSKQTTMAEHVTTTCQTDGGSKIVWYSIIANFNPAIVHVPSSETKAIPDFSGTLGLQKTQHAQQVQIRPMAKLRNSAAMLISMALRKGGWGDWAVQAKLLSYCPTLRYGQCRTDL